MDPREHPEFFEALEMIARLCDKGADRVIGHDDGRITFVWTEADFTATWKLAELLESPGANALLGRG